MPSHSFIVKRKAVPPLPPSDAPNYPSQQQQHILLIHPQPMMPAIHHVTSLPSFDSCPKRKTLHRIKKMLSFPRLSVLAKEQQHQQQHQDQHSYPHSNIGVYSLSDSAPPSQLPSPSPSTPTQRSQLPAAALSAIRISTSSSIFPTYHQSSYRASSELGRPPSPSNSPRIDSTPDIIELASPASQRSLLTSWYDAWFETQSLLEEQRQQEALRTLPEPTSFFEDDSDNEDEDDHDDLDLDRRHRPEIDAEADDEFTSDTESDYASILPDCIQSGSDEDEDSDTDIDDIDEGDVTLTVGRRVLCRRASCHLFSSAESMEGSFSDSSIRNRRAFEIDRQSGEHQYY